MIMPIDKERVRFYLWVALAYVALGVVVDVGTFGGHFPARVLNNFWRGCFILVINYLFYEYTLAFIRRRNRLVFKIPLFLIAVWLQLMLYSFGVYAWRSIGIRLHLYVELRTFDSIMEGVSYGFPFAFLSLIIFGTARHFFEHNKLKHAAQQLRIEKQQAELNYLKSQTNPHFLFNTLNNIYSLAKDKSDLTAESIVRLSKILRYMLYETKGEFVPVEHEVKIINDYIALEQLRYDDSLHVSFSHDVEDVKQALPPLLLIPLVENAFKHGVSETRNHPFVDIHLSVNQRRLTFVVKNSLEGSSQKPEVNERIGLSNLRRQLELLYSEFDLSVHQNESSFTATLTINLATHV
ncbi:MAG: histidine kinase [Bacteroidetes bacterium]|nr:histidine kinase [Bacteroidota bacterium]MCW5896784.1 histidine kinase [Bacteroidota bacterium]